MRPTNPFSELFRSGLLETLVPDFVLAFTFFTALSYAVLGKRFGRQKPAAAMSVAVGGALAIGLVWWERDHGWSVRNLGPMALGFGVIALGMTVFQAVRQTGGNWAGAGIALGAGLLVAWTLGFGLPVAGEILSAVVAAALLFGLLAFLLHLRRARFLIPPAFPRAELYDIRTDRISLEKDRRAGNWLKDRFRTLRRETDLLADHPEDATQVLDQIRRMLPVEGWLTERMARLRAQAHRVRKGHVARLEETKHVYRRLPPSKKKKAAAELIRRYQKLAGFDKRLERLDKAVAETERRIKNLTRDAGKATARYDFKKLTEILAKAEKLQDHNSHLFKHIDRCQQKLIKISRDVAEITAEETGK